MGICMETCTVNAPHRREQPSGCMQEVAQRLEQQIVPIPEITAHVVLACTNIYTDFNLTGFTCDCKLS